MPFIDEIHSSASNIPFAPQLAPSHCNNSLQGIMERTTDLPHGGNWLRVELDHKDEWRKLPEWMTSRGVWLMKSQTIERWYAWMPAPKVGE
jgi:hypothetical protein